MAKVSVQVEPKTHSVDCIDIVCKRSLEFLIESGVIDLSTFLVWEIHSDMHSVGFYFAFREKKS